MATADKTELRRHLSQARRDRPAADIERARDAVRDAVLARLDEAGWRCVAGYLPLRTEPGSIALLAGLLSRGVRVLVPVLLPGNDLDWAQWDGPGAISNPLGRTAIGTADAVLVPALAVAEDGTRLGRGGGSYDRALPRARAQAPVAALLYDGELVRELPRAAWDAPVTSVVTPSGWRDLSGGAELF